MATTRNPLPTSSEPNCTHSGTRNPGCFLGIISQSSQAYGLQWWHYRTSSHHVSELKLPTRPQSCTAMPHLPPTSREQTTRSCASRDTSSYRTTHRHPFSATDFDHRQPPPTLPRSHGSPQSLNVGPVDGRLNFSICTGSNTFPKKNFIVSQSCTGVL
jgi:hypothetical protein